MKGKFGTMTVVCLLLAMLVIVLTPTPAEGSPQGWTEDTRLTWVDNVTSSKPRIAVDSQNNLHLVFNDVRNGPPELYYMKFDRDGNILVNETAITELDSASSHLEDAVCDSQDNIHIVFSDTRDSLPIPNMELYYEKLDNNGTTLVDELRLTHAPYYSHYASMAVDSWDNIHIAYCEEVDIGSLQEEIFYMKLDSDGGTIINDTALTPFDERESLFPDIAVDSQGNVHIVWLDDRNETGTVQCQDLYYTKLDNAANTLVDDTLIFKNGDHFQPSIAVDADDMIRMTFSNRWFSLTNEKKHLYYMKRDNNGGLLGDVIQLNDNEANASHAVMDMDRWGNMHIVWEDERHENTEVFYTKLDDDGSTLIDDLRLTENPSQSVTPVVAMDENNSVNVVWADDRDYQDQKWEIYRKFCLESSQNFPPSVEIISPAIGETASGSFLIQGSADDSDQAVQFVQIKIDSGGWITVHGTTSWSVLWNTEDETNGVHTIRARSFDGINYSQEDLRDVPVYNEPPNILPVLTINSPSEGDDICGILEVKGTASDSDGSVLKVEVRIGNGGWTAATGTTSWSYPWDSALEEDGNYTIYVRAQDDDEEYSEVRSVSVTVFNWVNTPPEVAITFPTGGTVSGTVEIRGSASDIDGQGNITSVQVRIDGSWEDAQGNADWTYSWDTTAVDDGDHVITARASDEYDHSALATVSVYVDNPHEPTLTVTSELPDKASETITIEGTAADDDGEITKIEIQIDDGEWEEVGNATPWSYDLDTTDLSNGNHTIRIRVTDNEGEHYVETFIIDVDNGWAIPWEMLLLFGVIILIAFIAVVTLLSRKKSEPEAIFEGDLPEFTPLPSGMRTLRCPGCNNSFQADISSPGIQCPHCGLSGKI
ncbi:MAG: hypothetical protein JSW28_02370 [Thermoplasmata archaeon]|nr:MAG: hypothetical protein JSW28_02370 [Thermoplasmata archaeon]